MKEFWNRMTSNPESARKFIAAIIGALTTALAVGVLPQEYAGWLTIAIAFLTALGVYAVPNERKVLAMEEPTGTMGLFAAPDEPVDQVALDAEAELEAELAGNEVLTENDEFEEVQPNMEENNE